LANQTISPLGQAEIEPVVGGKFELFWSPEDKRKNSTFGCRITAIEQDQFLAFEWKGPAEFEQFMNNADPLTHVIVFFIPTSSSTTGVHLIHTGWRSSAEWEEARLWFERSWISSFENLKQLVNGSR
jgi:uncharacterized protein YndB with AHSA1/START domain